mgnify:CR=1 FL=1
MQLGWIDFSKEDRKKALDVINLLSEQGAVDELGIGIIRDAFANYFFPGTSTIQTRAKYFLIVPYVLREAVDGRYEERILRDIQNGITLEKLNMRKRKKTPEEKAAVLKMKRKQRRAKRQAMKNHAVENNTCQDDTFFYIAGYTSGGTPYGVTWEEMGLEPWQALEEDQ